MWKQEFFKIFARLLSFQGYQWPAMSSEEKNQAAEAAERLCCVKTCCS